MSKKWLRSLVESSKKGKETAMDASQLLSRARSSPSELISSQVAIWVALPRYGPMISLPTIN
jgi:hypothetical protein